MRNCGPFVNLLQTGVTLWGDILALPGWSLRSRAALAAENLFLPKRLALYRERQVKPQRTTDATRAGLVLLSYLIAWKDVFLGQPATRIRGLRQGVRLFGRWRSHARGQPPSGRGSPSMAADHPT